jgi:hypothetical protein
MPSLRAGGPGGRLYELVQNKINKNPQEKAMTAGARLGSPASASITARGANSRAAGAAAPASAT